MSAFEVRIISSLGCVGNAPLTPAPAAAAAARAVRGRTVLFCDEKSVACLSAHYTQPDDQQRLASLYFQPHRRNTELQTKLLYERQHTACSNPHAHAVDAS